MKKDNFLKGAFIATICLILTKILGVLYVIPFYSIIGERGSVIYGCAYNIYAVFVNISTVGIPLAVSKMVSEYNALDYHYLKNKTYRLASKIMVITAIVSTIVLNLLAPYLAEFIVNVNSNTNVGNLTGSALISLADLQYTEKLISDITFVIRISSTSILFVTIISVIRGYLQGLKYIKASSVAQVIEQFVRVLVILVGSYLCVKVLNTPIYIAVAIAVFGATLGAIVSYVYLKFKKDSIKDVSNYKLKKEEISVTNKYLFKRIIKYTIPFILLGVIGTSFELVDMFTVVSTLTNYASFSLTDASNIMNIVTTLGSKLNVIVVAIANGIVVSLLPNLTSDFVQGKLEEVRNKINKTLQMVFYITLPMAAGLSILAVPVWNVFYGKSEYGPKVFMLSIFVAIFSSIFTNVMISMQSLNRYKKMYLGLISGFLFNALMNVPFMIMFHKIGLPIYYGNLVATMIGYFISIIICLMDIKKAFNINYNETIKRYVHIIISVIIMAITLTLLKFIIPVDVESRILSIFIIALYAIIGFVIYFVITYKLKLFDEILGTGLKNKLKRKKKVENENRDS